MFYSLFLEVLSPKLYLDPGSGSMIIQLLLAALLGAGAMIAIYWRKIKAFFTGKKVNLPDDDDTEDEE